MMELKNARLVLFDFLCGENIDKPLMINAVKTVLEFPAIVPDKVITAADINEDI
jgi:hypothetical protein